MKKAAFISFLCVYAGIVFFACKKDDRSVDQQVYSSTPTLPDQPYDYVQSNNDMKAALGRVLFYDKNLSLNGSVSCASCHQQVIAFTDNMQFSSGLEDYKTTRNTPSIFAKNGRMFWDGRASGFNELALRPIKNHVEMGFTNIQGLVTKLKGISYYPALFNSAYGTSTIDTLAIQSALAEFLINFNFSNNKFNRSLDNIEQLSASEKLGKDIFFGKGVCSRCHHLEDGGMGNGYGFADGDFNIGLDENYKDKGIGDLVNSSDKSGNFMAPVLLNVEYTSPYMHDGRFKTLEEVVEHYNSGIKNNSNLDVNLRDLSSLDGKTEEEIFALLDKNHNGDIDNEEVALLPPLRLNLTSVEKKCLVDFLKTLSDGSILIDKRFNNPFVITK